MSELLTVTRVSWSLWRFPETTSGQMKVSSESLRASVEHRPIILYSRYISPISTPHRRPAGGGRGIYSDTEPFYRPVFVSNIRPIARAKRGFQPMNSFYTHVTNTSGCLCSIDGATSQSGRLLLLKYGRTHGRTDGRPHSDVTAVYATPGIIGRTVIVVVDFVIRPRRHPAGRRFRVGLRRSQQVGRRSQIARSGGAEICQSKVRKACPR